MIVGYSKLIIIDSIQVSNNSDLGHIYELEINQVNPSNNYYNSHEIDFSTLFKIGKRFKMKLPEEIKIYGIGVFYLKEFSRKCSLQLRKMIPNIAQYIINQELSLEEAK